MKLSDKKLRLIRYLMSLHNGDVQRVALALHLPVEVVKEAMGL